MGDLEFLSAGITDKLGLLEKRLEVVLRPTVPEQQGSIKDSSMLVPLANRMLTTASILRSANAHLESILSRLEL